MKQVRAEVLPTSLPPIGINREQAAAFIGISPSLYDKCVERGTMPGPRMIGGRAVYDVEEVIKAFRSIPHRAGDLDDEPTAGNAFDNAKKD
jgi:predicted DNA-binding transcriptional regulator AlpA